MKLKWAPYCGAHSLLGEKGVIMISKIKVHNFKAFDELNINLTPITLLLGPNNSGKSSIIAALRILIQTVESHDLEVPLLLNGSFGDFGTFRDIVYKNHRGRALELSADFSGIRSPLYRNDKIGFSAEFKFRTERRELVLNKSELRVNNNRVISTEYAKASEKQLISWVGDVEVPSPIKSTISQTLRMNNFMPRVPMAQSRVLDGGKSKEFITNDVSDNMRKSNEVVMAISRSLRNCDYLSAMRIPPERTYLFTGEKRNRIGAYGENAANLLAIDTSRPEKKKLYLVEKISKWLNSCDIAESITVEALSDRHYELKFKHAITKETQNIADVGYGNSQVFPVLVGGYSLSEGDTFIVEEPEIHLHPKAQAELGNFFLDLYDNGIQSIIETHSEHLILRLQQHVAEGLLKPKDISVLYVYPGADGHKLVKRLAIDKFGAFTDDWPLGFFPERLEEAKKLSQIRYAASKKATGGNFE